MYIVYIHYTPLVVMPLIHITIYSTIKTTKYIMSWSPLCIIINHWRAWCACDVGVLKFQKFEFKSINEKTNKLLNNNYLLSIIDEMIIILYFKIIQKIK